MFIFINALDYITKECVVMDNNMNGENNDNSQYRYSGSNIPYNNETYSNEAYGNSTGNNSAYNQENYNRETYSSNMNKTNNYII